MSDKPTDAQPNQTNQAGAEYLNLKVKSQVSSFCTSLIKYKRMEKRSFSK